MVTTEQDVIPAEVIPSWQTMKPNLLAMGATPKAVREPMVGNM